MKLKNLRSTLKRWLENLGWTKLESCILLSTTNATAILGRMVLQTKEKWLKRHLREVASPFCTWWIHGNLQGRLHTTYYSNNEESMVTLWKRSILPAHGKWIGVVLCCAYVKKTVYVC
mmetsp:Transcript_17526/g.35268  ORF Transcript_17526/g.35268 Transcript_17526/m.35268 type:complete len:118 (-) Transcript_17526:31-384(-)